MADQPPPRRRFQFSLRTLMIVVLVCSIRITDRPKNRKTHGKLDAFHNHTSEVTHRFC
jgi:hypothetical protein